MPVSSEEHKDLDLVLRFFGNLIVPAEYCYYSDV